MAALQDIVTKDSTDRSVVIRIIDSSDGTPETGVEHNTSGIDLWYRREGAAKSSITEAALAALTTAHTDGGIEHIADGEYRLDLPDAAFADGANYVDFGGTVTGMVVIGGRVRLVDFDIETALQSVNATQIEGSDATDQINAACDAAIETYGLDHLVSASVSGSDVADDSVFAYLVSQGVTADWDDFDNTTDSMQASRDNVGSGGASLSGIPWASSWDAEVQSECNDALVALGLDHLFSAAVTGGTVVDDSFGAQLVSKAATADFTSYDPTTDSLEAIRDRGDAEWTTGAGGTPPQLLQSTTIATLASQTSFTLTAGSADDDAYNGHLAIVTDQSTSTQKAVGIISDYTGSTKTITLDADPAIFTMATGDDIDIVAVNTASSAPTAAQVRAEIDSNSTQLAAIVADTNELQTDWADGGRLDLIVDAVLVDTAEIGTAGAGLSNIPWNASWDTEVQSECTDALNAYDPPTRAELTSDINGLNDPTAATIADAVWDEAQADHTTADTFGVLASEIATIDGIVDNIILDTAEIGAAGAGLTAVPWNASWDAEVQSECTDALNAYDPPTRSELTSDINGLNDVSVSDILTTQMTESYAANGTAPTLAQAMFATHQMLMQFAISGTSYTVKQLDNSSTAFVVTLDDGTSPTSAVRT